MSLSIGVDLTDPTPPYEQLRRQLSAMIGSGELALGDRLPPLRQLAGDLGLAVGTVARTYRELEAAGLIASRRGAGTRVVGVPETVPSGLQADAAAYVRRARAAGAVLEQAISALRKAWT